MTEMDASGAAEPPTVFIVSVATTDLRLESPDVIYRPEHIVRVAFDLIRTEDLLEEVEGREPMGFRTP